MKEHELIGLTWDAVDLEAGEIRITKTLRRWMDSNTQREWSDTKNRKHRIVPLTDGAVEVLRQHQTNLQGMGLMEPTGVVFLTKKNHQYLYDLLLERVWKRTLSPVASGTGSCTRNATPSCPICWHQVIHLLMLLRSQVIVWMSCLRPTPNQLDA